MTLHSDPDSIGRVEIDEKPDVLAPVYFRRGRIPLPVACGLYAGLEALVILFVATGIGIVYHALAFPTVTPWSVHIQLATFIAFLVVAASFLQGTYRSDQIEVIGDHPDRLALSVIFGLAALILLLFAAKKSIHFSRMVIFISGGALFFVLLALRGWVARILPLLVRRNVVSLPKILLVGSRSLMIQFLDVRSPARAHGVVGVHEISASPGDAHFEAEIGAVREIAQRLDVGSVVLCLPWTERSTVQACAEHLAVLPCALYLSIDPQLFKVGGLPEPADPSSLGHLILRRPMTPVQRAVKRCFDVVAAGAGLIVLAPVLAAIAIAIKLDSPGPVLFRQLRHGYNRSLFRVYKFRTMTAKSSSEGFRQATRHDARITRVGAFLRRTSLDELPQLFNVLGGTMSLVGPRPHVVELDEQFTPLVQHYATRHKIKPGITGWAQVKGHRGETRSTANMQDRISHDLYYLNHWSFWLDIKILLMTLTTIASQRNAF
jgi:Undecaprenyl-phosphate glucose phosphotransferase